MQKIIGGDIPLETSLNSFFTDSGRSSLRLCVRHLSNKKFLIPDYICKVVVDILKQEKIAFDFYKVKPDLTIDLQSLQNKTFDVFYLVNYFGQIAHDSLPFLAEKILLEDCVFQFDFENTRNAKQWCGFNSYRKVSALADGSFVKANLPIARSVSPGEAPFVEPRYKAKALKHAFVHSGRGNEENYLHLFKSSEDSLDQQTQVYDMSIRSRALLTENLANLAEDRKRRFANYEVAAKHLDSWGVLKKVSEPTFFVIRTKRRDELKRHLAEHGIYLPVHWPHFGVDNVLYEEALSIPLFAYYSTDDIQRVCLLVREFLDEGI